MHRSSVNWSPTRGTRSWCAERCGRRVLDEVELWIDVTVTIGRERNGRQSDEESGEVADLCEGGPDRHIGQQRGERRDLKSSAPRRPHISRQRARGSENEIAHPDIAGGYQSPGRPSPADHHPQMTLSDVGPDDMGRHPHQKPTPPTQSTFSGGDDSDEHRYVGPPLVVVEPEQTRRQYPGRPRAKMPQIRGIGPLNASRLPTARRPLNAGGDQQDEQPCCAQRSANQSRHRMSTSMVED